MSVSISKLPILPVVELRKNDGSIYTYNPFVGTFDFRLRGLALTPPVDGIAGKFKMKFTSNAPSHAQTNTILSNIEEGNEVLFYVGKSDAAKLKIMRGVIDTVGLKYVNKNYFDPYVSGPDWGSDILQWRIVNGAWHQQREADGITLKASDNSTLIRQLVVNLLTLKDAYPVFDVTAENQGIVVNIANINPPSLQIPDFESNMEYLEDKLKELDEIGGTIHYVDPDKNFIMHRPTIASSAVPSGILLTDDFNDSVALGWDQTKVGLIKPNFEHKKTVEAHYRRLFGLGGDQQLLDPKQETDTTSTNLNANYLAQRFTPVYRRCDYIGVFIRKVGSPTVSLFLELIEDNGNAPTGNVLRALSKQTTAIGTVDAWHYFSVGEEINTAKNYWIVLRKNGDATNTFAWHRNNLTNAVNAFSADGVTWTIQSSSYSFMFRIYSSNPLLNIIPGVSPAATAKHFHEAVVRKPAIKTREVMQRYLIGLTQQAFKRKQIVSGLVRAPDTMITNGQKIRIRIQQSGFNIDDEFVTGPVEYNWASSEELTRGIFWYNIEAVKFLDY